MIAEIYDALIDAGASEEKSKKAAVAYTQQHNDNLLNLVTKDHLYVKITELDKKISDVKTEILKWMFTMSLAQITIIVGLIKLL